MGCRLYAMLPYDREKAKMVSFTLSGVKGDEWGCERSQVQSKIVT